MSYDIAGTTVIANDRRITAVSFTGYGAVPYGGIVLWYGSVANIPDGWNLCDGTNSTPDLRDRFIVCAGNTYAVADTGGASNVTLTTAEIPAHTHNGNTGNQSANHEHGGTTGNVNRNHYHGGSTGGPNRNHSHGGTTSNDYPDHAHNAPNIPNNNTEYGNRSRNAAQSARSSYGTSGANRRHVHNFGTGGISANHEHGFNTGNISQNHQHGFNTGGPNRNHSHGFNVGGGGTGGAHENKPPYYALCYIMRTGT